MPTGYLVTLGDGNLDAGDVISGGAITFAADGGYPTGLGAGQWTWSGWAGGSPYTNELEPGHYWLADDGNVYFVPDYGTVDTLDSATVSSAPTYTASDGIVSGTSGDDLIDGGYTDTDGDVVDGGDGTGPSGHEDAISAGAGNDTVLAGQEDDTVYGGTGHDSLAGQGGDDLIYGEDGDDTLQGGFGVDTLHGGSGKDSIRAGSGDDQLFGGEGDDTLYGGDGADNLDGGDGLDVASYEGSDAGVNVNLETGSATGGHATGDTLYGIDGLIGSDHDDTLVGFDGSGPDYTNIIDGGAGDDYIDGRGSDDTLIGGSGHDTLIGGDGADSIQGDGQVAGDQMVNGTFDSGTSGWTGAGDGGIENGAYVWGLDSGSGTLTYDTSLTGLQDGPGAHGAGQVVFDFAWNNGAPDLAATRTLELQIDGVTYATITTGGLNGTEATITYSNGASGPLGTVEVNPTYVGGPSAVFTTITVDLPVGVSETGTLSFVASSGGSRDDLAVENVQVITNTETSGNDSIDGGTGDDTIDAGLGEDTVTGGVGSDAIDLGADSDRDTVVLEDGSGTDTISSFDLTDFGDGTTVDQFDVSGLTDAGANPVNAWDVVVTDTNGDGTGDAILTFPNGESVTLEGVLASQVDSAPELFAMGIPCFTSGTQIATPRGEISVEELREGDLVTTLEYGPLPVHWIASSDLGESTAPLPENVMPVRSKPGSLGSRRPLIVSPQHCILMKDRQAGQHVYVRAKHLAEETRLASFARGRKQVTYVHALLDKHATLISNDIPSESFYPGPMALKMLSVFSRMSLYAEFPQLIGNPCEIAYGARAARVLTRKELRKAVADEMLACLEVERLVA